MNYDITQIELDYWHANDVSAEVFDDGCCAWIRNRFGDLPCIVHNDDYTFNIMKDMQISVHFYEKYVTAMARDGITPVCVYYADKGYLSNRELVNLAIVLAATEKLKADK
jgi:hypothetical protein